MSGKTATGPLTYKQLARRYWKWEVLGVLVILIGIGVSWAGLWWIAEWRFAMVPDQRYWLSPSALVWSVPAFFAGILAATWPTDLLYRRLLGDRYPEFRDYQTRKFGYDGRRWMLAFYLLFGTANVAFILLMLDCYVFFGPNTVQIDELWSLQPHRFTYDQILEIRASDFRQAANGEVEKHYTLALHFADGNIWVSTRDGWYAGREHLREIAEYVSSRSGIPIVEVGTLTQAELFPYRADDGRL